MENKKTKTAEESWNEMEAIKDITSMAGYYGVIDKQFKLIMFTEGSLIYEYTYINMQYVLDIISDDDFFAEESLRDLLEKKRIEFMNFSVNEIETKPINSVKFAPLTEED
jgi:hypothetical protein